MAGRVNTKFVALLVVAAVVVLGSGVALYWFMFNKTGDTYAALALEAEAAGDWEAAEENWGRAVGHENTNIEWLDGWANALGHIVPSTETDYRDKFNQFRSIKRQVAVTARTDVERTGEYLNLYFESFSRLGGGSRPAVENFANEVAFMLAYYPEGGPLQEQRDRLRRYRGLAWAQLAGTQSTLTEDEIEAAKDDLRAALAVEPGDGRAMRALVRLLDTEKARAETNDDRQEATRIIGEQRDAVNAVLAVDPENLWAQITMLDIEAEPFTRLTGDAREAERVRLYDQLDAVLRNAEAKLGTLTGGIIDRLTILEGLLDPTGMTPRSIALLESAVESGDEPTEMLLQLANLRERYGDYEAAMRDARRAEAQESLPVSLDGWIRLFARRQAPLFIAEFAVKRIDEGDAPERVQELLEIASEARDRFITGVGTDAPRVAMLDGQIAAARAEYLLATGDQRGGEAALNEALGHFASFNQKTGYSNRDGLWREGLSALRLNKTGLARERLGELLALEPRNANVLLGLADIEERLGTEASLDEAFRYTQRAAELAPGNQAIQDRLNRLAELTFRERPDDPIKAIVFESEQRFQGKGLPAPDAMGAEKLLRDGLAEHGQDPALVRQLVRILMFTDRLDEAREVTNKAFDANPDDPTIAQLKQRLEADSLLEIVEQTIRDSNASELDKLLQIVEARRLYGEPGAAAEALAEAKAMAPDDPDVLEQDFLQQLDSGNLEGARAIAQRAREINADRLDGITYQARVYAAENRHAEAVELLREAVSRRPADAPLWRLLATEQSSLGRVAESLESYRQSLSITLNDPITIRGYIALLATTGQLDEALSEARRLRDFGEVDPSFVDMYLRLEANQGGDEGLATAIRRRTQILGEQPFNIGNKLQLARLYIEDRDWQKAKAILDELESEGEGGLARVEVLAKWYADQGRVRQDDGYRDGIELARGAFIEHIVGVGEPEATVDAYIAMARFMIERGRDDVALRAVEEARAQQDPERLRAEKLFGEIMMRRNMWRPAAEAFRKVVDAGADESNDQYRKLLIEMLLRINELDEARQQIASLSDRSREDLTVLMQSADIAMAQGQEKEALRLVDRAIELYPSRPLPFVKRAQFLMPNEALASDVMRNLEEALRLNPNDYQAHKLMATMHYRRGDDDRALESLRASMRANPTQDSVLVGLLIELLERDRVGEAVDVANEVIEARPTDATLMLVMGRVFLRRDQFDRAAGLFEQAWELTRDERVAMAYIDALLRSENPRVQRASRVIQELEVLGNKVDEDPQLLATRAAIEARGGKMARAASFLTRAYEQALGNPGLVLQWVRNVRVVFDDDGAKSTDYILNLREQMPANSVQRDWLTYGAATLRAQDERQVDQADADLIALQKNGANDLIKRLAHRLLGSGRFGRGDFEGAAQAWRAGIEAFPDDWEMHNNLAYCIGIELGRPAEAVPLARQATQLADSRADVYDTLGNLLLKSGELDEAEDALLTAKERVRTERERVNVLLNLARLALKRGNTDEARRLWTDADTAIYTLPDLREVVGDDLAEVKQEIDSAPSAD